MPENQQNSFGGGIPYTVSRLVRWGDCDPAGVIYTPRVFHYSVELIEEWYRNVVGVHWYELLKDHSLGSPTVRTECDFIRPLMANMVIKVQLRVEKLGNASITLQVDAIDSDGLHYFRIMHVSCLIKKPEFKPVAMPAEYRERILAYQRACGDE